MWFGLPNHYNEGQQLKLAYSNLKEYGTKLNALDGGFVFCVSTYYERNPVKIVKIEKLS